MVISNYVSAFHKWHIKVLMYIKTIIYKNLLFVPVNFWNNWSDFDGTFTGICVAGWCCKEELRLLYCIFFVFFIKQLQHKTFFVTWTWQKFMKRTQETPRLRTIICEPHNVIPCWDWTHYTQCNGKRLSGCLNHYAMQLFLVPSYFSHNTIDRMFLLDLIP